MRKVLTLLGIASLAVFTLSACSLQDPVTYNDNIIDILEGADIAYGDYATYAQETSNAYLDKIDQERTNAASIQQ